MEILTPNFRGPIEHDFPFDPTYRCTLETLLEVEAAPEPSDFAAFWEETYQQTLSTPLNLAQRPDPLGNEEVEVLQVEFDSLDEFRIGGWLVTPRRGTVKRGLVISHGYGGREAPVLELPPETAAIFPCARGFHRSARDGFPATSARHVLHGIKSRETYSHRGSAADVWAATSALIALKPEIEDRISYKGASFGGGIGALAVPWEKRFRRAFFDVPSFGPHPLRVTLPCVGSGEAVRKYYQRHPGVLEVLQYFDSTVAATQIAIPTLVAAALFDPAVPPPGQFAVYNALPSITQKQLLVRQMAHFDHPIKAEEDRLVSQRVEQWFLEDK